MVNAFYFGENSRRLFGLYDPPTRRPNGHLVLICHPIGQEYLRTYRCFKLLAQRLSGAGTHVMRFDYFGTGDSAGHTDECDIEHWLDDINLAIEEAKAVSAINKISIIGLRLGATLAAIVSKNRKDIRNLFFWDPVIDGNKYLSSLRETHQQMLVDTDRFALQRTNDECDANELVGYSYSDKLIDEIESLNDEVFVSCNAKKMSLLSSSYTADMKRLCEKNKTNDIKITLHEFESSVCWTDVAQIETAFMPQDIITHIASEIIK